MTAAAPRLPLPTVPTRPPPPAPSETCPVCPRLASEFDAWWTASFYHAMHRRAVQREQRHKDRVRQLEAEVRLLKQKLFGKSAEATPPGLDTAPPAPDAAPAAPPPRSRGQQSGRPSPPRRDHNHLPAVDEVRDLPDDQKLCPCCGQPFAAFPGTEDSELLEVEVKAHRRQVRRQRYRPTCACENTPPIVVAPPAPRVIPKCHLGVSIWVLVLLDKYLFHRPTYRLLAELKAFDLDLSLGTVTDGLRRLEPLLPPLYEALGDRSRTPSFWHADETRWQVHVTREGKVGFRWYLWVFHAPDCVVFVLSPTRAHEVPEEHFGEDGQGILVVDRYKAYQALGLVKGGTTVLAFCGAHVRRDFLDVAKWTPEHADRALAWVERIGTLYHLNDQRCEALAALDAAPKAAATSDAVPTPTPEIAGESPPRQPPDTAAQRRLVAHLEAMRVQRDAELVEPKLAVEKRKALMSLGTHWPGLSVFADHPEVPLDKQRGGAGVAGSGGGSEELFGVGIGVERSAGGDAVQSVPDGVAGKVEPASVAECVPGGVRGGGG